MMNDTTSRSFLQTLGGFGLASAMLTAWAFWTKRHPRFTPEEVKQRVRGPILTLPTPFTGDFKVDYAGVRNMVELAVANGVVVHELTNGNSQYSVLSYEEIKKLTKVFVEAVRGRGIVIAATGPWWTRQAVDYARYAESVGADAVQVLLPPDGSVDGYVRHFQEIAAATKLAIALHGAPTPQEIERFIEVP